MSSSSVVHPGLDQSASALSDAPALTAAAGTLGAQLLREFNAPGSVVSKYVRPMASPKSHEETAGREAERMARDTGRSDSGDASGIFVGVGGVSRPSSSSTPSSRSAGRRTTPAGANLLATGGRRSVAAASAQAQAGASTAMVPAASPWGRSAGPYHSPLQRQVIQLYPESTEAQLAMHSKFTPSFYLGPACRSLDDGIQDFSAPSGTAVRWGVWKEEKARPDQANYTIGTHALAPTQGTGAMQVQYSNLKPLDVDQRSLLQSAFDRIDEVYPLPGSGAQKKGNSIRDTIAINRSAHGSNTEEEAKMRDDTIPDGMKRQLVPRLEGSTGPNGESASGGPGVTYDVFHLPFGFKVVRDDSVDPRTWGGTTKTDAIDDAGVKERVRGVLDGLQEKYAPAVFDQKPTTTPAPGSISVTIPAASVQFHAQGPNSPPPVAALASPLLSKGDRSSKRSSLLSGAADRPGSSHRPKSSPRNRLSGSGDFLPSSGSTTPRDITTNQRFLTPGPEIELADGPGVDAYGRKAASAGLEDEREIIPVDYEKEMKRNRRTQSGKHRTSSQKARGGPPQEPPGIVVGKVPNRVVPIAPSRGTQLLNKIGAQVRCCCLVPQTGSVWSVQRDAVLIVRERMTGRQTHKWDTQSLIWCMLLVDNGVMWLGTETGVILAYNVYTHQKLRQVTNHAGGIHCLVRGSGDGSIVFSGSNDFTMSAWTLGTMEIVQSYMGHAGGVRCILPLSAGRVWTGGDDGALRIWDVETGGTVEELVRHTGSVLSLITTGQHIWSAGEDGTMCQWSISPEVRCLKQISTGPDRIQTLMLVGHHVWSCGQDPRIHVWSAANMDWLGALRGHARYLSAFVKVRIMETRIIWSYGLGEENILVWRVESICEDARDQLVALTAQLISQADEIAHLRQRVALAEAAQQAIEEARERERAAFAKQLEDLLLQLAQAQAGRDAQAKALADALRELANLAAQNARLRNELRLHLEKLKAGEDVIRNLLDKVDTKEEHIARLQADALKREEQWRAKLANLEREHGALMDQRLDGQAMMEALAKQLAEYKSRTAELERLQAAGHESAAYYQRENARLAAELDQVQKSAAQAELSARLRAEAAHHALATLEKNVLDLTAQVALRDEESTNLRRELARAKVEWMKEKAARETGEKDTRERERAWEEERKAMREDRARMTLALHGQSKRIAGLEKERAEMLDHQHVLSSTLNQVARELQVVERRVHSLSKPSASIYSIPRPTAVTFQQVAARRDAYDPGDPIPPAPFFDEITGAHGHISRIMYRCLNQLQKLHVGYTPAPAADAIREADRADRTEDAAHRGERARATTSKSAAHHRPSSSAVPEGESDPSMSEQKHQQQHAAAAASHDDRDLYTESDPPSLANTGTFSVREVADGEYASEDEDESNDGAGPDQLAGVPEDSSVQNVWLNPPASSSAAAAAPGPPLPSSTAAPPFTAPSTPTAASASSVSRVGVLSPSRPARPRLAALPLVHYNLNSSALQPVALAAGSTALSGRLTVEAKRAADAQREARLMQLEHQTQRRKVQIRRAQMQHP